MMEKFPVWLAVDFGNTRVKWALMDKEKVCQVTIAPPDWQKALLTAARAVNEVWVSYVGEKHTQEKWLRRLSAVASVHCVRPRKQLLGVHNEYRPPDALGVDRWLCLLGARYHRRSQVIIVSAGTAVTVDALDEHGHFAGGIILPGLNLMHQALQHVAHLPRVETATVSGERPNNTQDAIRTGSVWACVGAIRLFRHRWTPTAPLLVSGGDAKQLLPFLTSAQHRPHLLFTGMAHYRKAIQCEV